METIIGHTELQQKKIHKNNLKHSYLAYFEKVTQNCIY